MSTNLENQFVRDLNDNAGIIHRICRVYFPDEDDRKDVFQEVVYQLWKSYSSFKGQSKFSTWMYRVALNIAIARVRNDKRSIAKESLHDLRSDALASNDPSMENEQLALLYDAINTLSLIDKAIILLHLEENNYDEIALITGLTKVNVSVRLVRIKKKLEEIVKNQSHKK